MPRFEISKKDFGNVESTPVEHFRLLDTETGISVSVTPFGATLQSVRTPDRKGNVGDVLLGHGDASGYANGRSYQGATIGRYTNRIGGARFTLNGREYMLSSNEGGNNLHGGAGGFSKKLWNVGCWKVLSDDKGAAVGMCCLSKDGEDGFPGNVNAGVVFALDKRGLEMRYHADTDKPTVFSTCQHGYWNLGGTG
jgi:aldose 1-epimerase